MIIPSMTLWGLPSSRLRSMKAPGSPSSALQMMYFGVAAWARITSHFWPVGKPAPPAQTGALHPVHHLLGGELGQHARQGRIAAHAQVVVDRLGVNLAVVAEEQAHLAAVEGHLLFADDALAGDRVLVEEAL